MIRVNVTIAASATQIWDCFTQAEHVVHWNFASEDWHCPHASNDLTEGGSFAYTMAAKDGSFSFVLKGTFDRIAPPFELDYHLEDGRTVQVRISENGEVVQEFEPEHENSEELQQQGWQSILNAFKKYVESK